jgi:subtilase family serine protease
MLRTLKISSKAIHHPLAIVAGLIAFVLPALASAQSLPRITTPVDDADVVVLKGNTHPLASARFDQGPVDDSVSGKMLLVLKRSPEQEQALRQLTQDQLTVGSPNFHKWLTPEQFGEQFGVADADIQTVTGYLSAHGFTVGRIYKSKMAVEVSGSAGLLRDTFHTEIHHYTIQGHEFYANASDPSIPAALAPVVRGFAALNNIREGVLKQDSAESISATFEPKTHKLTPNYTGGTGSGTYYLVAPADLQTIYNIPVSSGGPGAAGAGVTVGVIGDSQINLNLVTQYQTVSGATVKAPVEIVDGDDPAILTTGTDATIAYEQLELINAAAPSANLNYYVSATTDYDTGLDFAMIRAVDDDAVSVLAFGFQSCEATLGATSNAFVNALWQQAAAQGITVVAAAGDAGSAGCDTPGSTTSSKGLAVNGYASTPYNTAVGGTDFYYGTNGAATYWSTTDSAVYGSAKSYIPEQPWDDSYQATNSNAGTSVVYGGGGGFSTVGNVAADGVTVSPYPTPSWQTSFLPVGTTARAIPDVSFFAGNNANSAEYAICAQPNDCIESGTTLTDVTLTGGTAGAAAVFAGIMAEVVEKYGVQGNANPALYGLYSTAGVFHAATVGTNSVACSGGTGCSGGYLKASGVYAYKAATGYNEATGLGSVNATNLINDWKVPSTKSSATALAITNYATNASVVNTSVVHGTPLNFVATVTGSGGTPTGNVSITTGSVLPSAVGLLAMPLVSGVATSDYTDLLPGGTYNVVARYAGDSTFNPSVTSQPITITPEPSRILIDSSSMVSGSSVPFGTTVTVTVEPFSMNNNDVSTPTGTLSVFNSGASYPFLLMPVGSEGTATFSSTLLPGNTTYNLLFSYSGDSSYQPSTNSSNLFKLIVTQASTTTTLAATNTAATSTTPITLTATVQAATGSAAASTGVAPTGSVTFSTSTTAVPLVAGFNTSGQAIGVASIQVTSAQLNAGGTAITATYSSDGNYAASTSSTTLNSANGGGTTTTLTLSANNTTVAANGALTITGTAKAGNTGEPGTVQLYANGVKLTGDTFTLNNAGTGSYSVPIVGGYLPFASGSVVITGVFTPSNNGIRSSSSTITLTVTDDRTTADFSISTDTLTKTISPSSSNVYFQLQLTSVANFASLNNPIALSCAVPGGSNLRCTLGSSSVTMGTSGIALTTVEISGYPTINNGALKPPAPQDHWWLLGGGTTLACVFILGIPARRKGWQGMLTVMVCIVFVAGSITGCGSNALLSTSIGSNQLGGGSGHVGANLDGGIATNNVAPGNYAVVITGTATTNTTLIHNTQVTVVVTTTPVLANGTYSLTNLSSQALMTDPNASTAPGTQIEQFSADGTNDQKWIFTYSTANPGYYTIQNAGNGLYVTDPGSQDCSGSVTSTCSSGASVTVVTLQAATNDATQLWTFDLLEGGYQIISGASGGVLDDDAFGSNNGTPVICYPPKDITDADNQTWYIQ